MFEWELLLGVALISFLGTYVVIRLAPLMGLLHIPNDRSSHSILVPHGGGLGIVAAGSIAGCWIMAEAQEIWIVGLALLLGFVGLVDDIRHLSAKMRFALQGSVVAVLLWLMGPLPEMAISLPQAGNVVLIGGWLLTGLLFWTGLWWLNLFNFMDGIDGIAAMQALSMLSAAAVLSFIAQPDVIHSAVWWYMLYVASATLGFLLLNWPPAKVFMGDVGSLWLGFSIFALALLSIQENWLNYGVWMILAALFVSDATVTLLTRMMCGERWYEAHRSHAYQRLSRHFAPLGMDARQSQSLGHRRVTLGALLINLFWLSPLALAAVLWPQWIWALVLIAYLPLIAVALLAGSGKPDYA
ncbi:MAG: MraY family glycosyltransferase [Cycloclasticus sp.]